MIRRKFLKISSIGAVGIFAGGSNFFESCKMDPMIDMMMGMPVPVTEGNFSDALIFPNVQTGAYALSAQSTSGGLFNGNNLGVYGYQNNEILGPTLKLNSGEMFSVDFQNNLSEATNIHWHGLNVPANMDGYPTDVILNGASFNYVFPVNQRASMYWYHPHPDMKTGEHTFKGLAGLIIVNDAEEELLNLPSGDNELLLVIQDKRISSNNIIYSPADSEIMSGYMGEYIFVNGVYAPFHDVSTKQYRTRILNGSNARVYNLALSNGAFFNIIGSDGGLLSSPELVNSVLLGPGERIDIIIDFRSNVINDEIFLISKIFSGGDAQGTQEFKILKFVVSTSETDSFTLPGLLSSISMLNEAMSVRSRGFDISNPHGEEGHGGGMTMSNGHNINGKTFDAARIDETINAGDIEIWTFDNTMGGEPHPMHLHGNQFQILDRTNGSGIIPPHEKGWKDTVLVMPKEIVRIIIPFGTELGKFVFHCHNLEHEDDGMMLNYLIN